MARHETVCKKMSYCSFENFTDKRFVKNKTYIYNFDIITFKG